MKKITLLGFGSFGIALSKLLHQNGHNVCIYARSKEKADIVRISRVHNEYMPDVYLHNDIQISSNMREALYSADAVVVAVPSKAVRETVKLASLYLKEGTIIICTAKGLEDGTLMRLSEVIDETAKHCKTAVLSGPCHAEEVAIGLPTTCVVASKDDTVSQYVQGIFFSPSFRVYTNRDIIGVEMGGALKNVIALAAGICDGLGFGDNAKAALMTRGISEIARLGAAMGAEMVTFSGLAGIGDLIVTCTSMHSRNRRAGILIGKGKSLSEALNEVHTVVEGVSTAHAAYELSLKHGVEMPIITEICNALFNGKDMRQAVNDLMNRDKKDESNNYKREAEELTNGFQF